MSQQNNSTRSESRASLFSAWLSDLNQRVEQELGCSVFDVSEEIDYFAYFEEERLSVSQMFRLLSAELNERR